MVHTEINFIDGTALDPSYFDTLNFKQEYGDLKDMKDHTQMVFI